MKIAFTISDGSHAAHIGGEIVRRVYTVEIDDASIPDPVKDAIREMDNDQKKTSGWSYLTASISFAS